MADLLDRYNLSARCCARRLCACLELPAKEVMVTRLETISADAPIRELVPLFRRDLFAIVMDGSRFLGIATRLDLVNYFRIAQGDR